MFNDPREIIKTLENAIELFGTTNSAIQREKAKLMVVGSRHALQALALEFAKERFPIENGRIIPLESSRSRISKNNGHEKVVTKRSAHSRG